MNWVVLYGKFPGGPVVLDAWNAQNRIPRWPRGHLLSIDAPPRDHSEKRSGRYKWCRISCLTRTHMQLDGSKIYMTRVAGTEQLPGEVKSTVP